MNFGSFSDIFSYMHIYTCSHSYHMCKKLSAPASPASCAAVAETAAKRCGSPFLAALLLLSITILFNGSNHFVTQTHSAGSCDFLMVRDHLKHFFPECPEVYVVFVKKKKKSHTKP